MKRKSVTLEEDAALDCIRDGMTVALGGFITAQHAMAMVRGMAPARYWKSDSYRHHGGHSRTGDGQHRIQG